jgi:hypothetical protein
MQPLKKNYPVFVHVLHSRLQLVRNKIQTSPDMTASEMVLLNLPLFELIRDAVYTFHNYKPGRSDYQQAAELYLSTLDEQQKEIENQPVWKPRKDTGS